MKYYAPNVEFISFFLIFKSNFLVKIVAFLLNSAFVIASLDLISHVFCVYVWVADVKDFMQRRLLNIFPNTTFPHYVNAGNRF